MNYFEQLQKWGRESHTKRILNLRYVKNQFLINITFHILQKRKLNSISKSFCHTLLHSNTLMSH
jgi:hypothetical protein